MRNTLQYILKKLLALIPMLLIITFLIYLGLELTPGDAISYMIPADQLANVDPAKMEALRELYGLNDPFILRYLKWLGQLLTGNFGYSTTSGVPATCTGSVPVVRPGCTIAATRSLLGRKREVDAVASPARS